MKSRGQELTYRLLIFGMFFLVSCVAQKSASHSENRTQLKQEVLHFLSDYRSLFGQGKPAELEKYLTAHLKKRMGKDLAKTLSSKGSAPQTSMVFVEDLVQKDHEIYVRWFSDQTSVEKRKFIPWYILIRGGPKHFQIWDISSEVSPYRPQR